MLSHFCQMALNWFGVLVFLTSSISNVAATGGFPPVNGPPGACGLLPADASCTAVFLACVKTLENKADPYSNEACVAAASCYPINPDSFLSNLYCRLSGPQGAVPQSANIPRVPDTIANKLLVNDLFVSYQSYASWYKNVVATADADVTPLIDPAFVKMSYDIILAWTGLCSSGHTPKSNFIDWFQFSSSVKGSATTCNLVPNCPITFYPYVIDLAVTCAKHKGAISDPFNVETCAAAALNWQEGIDSFLQAVACRYNINFNTDASAPQSDDLPALSSNLSVSNSPPYTEQNFTDFTNSTVSSIGTSAARSPSTNIDYVTDRWQIIITWTNSCKTGTVSQSSGLSDFLKHSHIRLTSTSCHMSRKADADA